MSHFEERRAIALAETTDLLTIQLLNLFPRMVSHPAPSGVAEICYQDGDMGGAIACSQSEIHLLNLFGKYAQKTPCLEIGSYVGWSSAALLYNNPQMTLHCVDAFVEQAGYLHIEPDQTVIDRFTENMRAAGLSERIVLHIDWSPGCIPGISEQPWGLVFLDGWHLDGQPAKDVDGIIPWMADDGVLILHDVWMQDVYAAARGLLFKGWHMTVFPTANTLAVLYRVEPAWWNRFLKEAI